VKGGGNTDAATYYSAIDQTPYTGRSYYRLRQTDYDGKSSTSPIRSINYDGPASPYIKVYPNPTNGRVLTLEIAGLKDNNHVPLKIYDQRGQNVFETILSAQGPGLIRANLNLNLFLPAGLYIIKAGQTLQLTDKIVVE
jgi:hypothetical protein